MEQHVGPLVLGRKTSRLREERASILFVLPVLIILVILSIVPLGWTLITSLRIENLFNPANSRWVGAGNFVYLATIDETFWRSIYLTSIWTVVTVSIELVLGFLLALLLDSALWGIGILRTLIILPVFVSPVAMGLTWRFMFEPVSGIVNYVLGLVGIQRLAWHTSPETSLAAVMVVDIWQWTPFVAIILLAGMQSVPTEIIEAARLDRIRGLNYMRNILLPLVWPVMTVVVLLRLVDAIRMFDSVYVITRGGPGTSTLLASINMYLTFLSGRLGTMAAFGIVLVLAINFVVVWFLRLLHRQERHVGGLG
jgi:multiple sugar transport system permease protein